LGRKLRAALTGKHLGTYCNIDITRQAVFGEEGGKRGYQRQQVSQQSAAGHFHLLPYRLPGSILQLSWLEQQKIK